MKWPCGGLRGAAQLLEGELPDAALREYAGVIIREADRLTTLVDRMIGPRRPPRMEPVDIHEVTERVRALVNAETPASIVVERDHDPSIPVLAADPERLIQAMLYTRGFHEEMRETTVGELARGLPVRGQRGRGRGPCGLPLNEEERQSWRC